MRLTITIKLKTDKIKTFINIEIYVRLFYKLDINVLPFKVCINYNLVTRHVFLHA